MFVYQQHRFVFHLIVLHLSWCGIFYSHRAFTIELQNLLRSQTLYFRVYGILVKKKQIATTKVYILKRNDY